jgi:DnaJ-class molecular chaperone
VAAERDAYAVLQVDPKANAVVLRAAHHALASLYHPDLDQSGSSTRRMAELNQAWEKVRTPERRELYDRQRSAGQAAAAARSSPRRGPRLPQHDLRMPPAPASTSAATAAGRWPSWRARTLSICNG